MAVSFQEIGRRIAANRNALGLTQEILAERVGVSRGVMSKIENGQKAITALEMKAVCDALGLALDALISEEPRNLLVSFMGSARTPAAKQAIACADRLAEEFQWQLRISEGKSPC